MLAILSPARNIQPWQGTSPASGGLLFPREAQKLVRVLRERSPWELESLLDVNPARALELFEHFQAWDVAKPGTPALLSYKGAAFSNLSPGEFDPGELAFAQEHLRILSALYGMLRPLDGVLPHRLGLGKQLRVDGQTLHQYWGDRLYRELYRTGEPVVSLTSADYAKLITPYLSPGRDVFLTCRFLVQKRDGARGSVNSVRTARGQMARYIVKNRIDRPEGLRHFDWEGYRFIPGRSDSETLVFIQNPSKAYL